MSIIERERVTEATVTTRDVLHRAADLLEEFGWTQGAYARPIVGPHAAGEPIADGVASFCAAGAFIRAEADLGQMVPDTREIRYSYGAAAGRLSRILGLGQTSVGVTVWNDAPERTKTEVVAKLREAAALTPGVAQATPPDPVLPFPVRLYGGLREIERAVEDGVVDSVTGARLCARIRGLLVTP